MSIALRDSRDEVLTKAFKELAAWRRRYEDLVELAEIVAAIDAAENKAA